MKLKSIVAASTLAFLMAAPGISSAATIMNIEVYNNLYNEAATAGAAGMTPSSITAEFFNGATQCDSAVVGFRALITEVVGTGSNQKCASVSSVKIVAGFSTINTALQVYAVAPVTVAITTSDYEHAIIVQDLGTGVTGTAAADGSIAPVFDATNGLLTTTGTPGTLIKESKL